MTTAKNPITGDNLISKATNDAYRDNYDAIFRKKDHEPENEPECSEHSVPASAELEEAVNKAIQWPFPTVNGERQ